MPSDISIVSGNDLVPEIVFNLPEIASSSINFNGSMLLSPAEIDEVLGHTGLLEQYVSYAMEQTDASPIYHVSGFLTVLSTVVGRRIYSPLLRQHSNLFFLNLGPSTYFRKTTAQNIAVKLIEGINSDFLIAGDFSPESLMKVLSKQDKKSSLLYVDEASALLSKMKTRDYMAAAKEILTKLYDGDNIKRVLMNHEYSVKDPYLTCLWGTTIDRVVTHLSSEDVYSGFLIRFAVAMAHKKLKYRPLRYDSPQTQVSRDLLIKELTAIMQLLSIDKGFTSLRHSKTDPTGKGKGAIWALFEDSELDRLDEYNQRLIEEDKDNPFLLQAHARTSELCQKIAMLLQVSELPYIDNEGCFYVSRINLVKAIYLTEVFRCGMTYLAREIDRGVVEKRLARILELVEHQPGITRSKVMRNFALSSKEMTDYKNTLEERNLIKVEIVATKTKPVQCFWIKETQDEIKVV